MKKVSEFIPWEAVTEVELKKLERFLRRRLYFLLFVDISSLLLVGALLVTRGYVGNSAHRVLLEGLLDMSFCYSAIAYAIVTIWFLMELEICRNTENMISMRRAELSATKYWERKFKEMEEEIK